MSSFSSAMLPLFDRNQPDQFSAALLRCEAELQNIYADHFIAYRGDEIKLAQLSSIINNGMAGVDADDENKNNNNNGNNIDNKSGKLEEENLKLYLPTDDFIKEKGRTKEFYLAELNNSAKKILIQMIAPNDLQYYENEIKQRDVRVLWKIIYDTFHRINESVIKQIKNNINELKYDSSVGIEKFVKDLRRFADHIRRLNPGAYTHYQELNFIIDKLKIEKYFETKIKSIILSNNKQKYSLKFIDELNDELIDIEKVEKEIESAKTDLADNNAKDINVAGIMTMNRNNNNGYYNNNNNNYHPAFINNHRGRGRGGRNGYGFNRGGRGGYQNNNNFNNNNYNNNDYNNNNFGYDNNNNFDNNNGFDYNNNFNNFNNGGYNNGFNNNNMNIRGRGGYRGRGRGRGGFNNNFNNNNTSGVNNQFNNDFNNSNSNGNNNSNNNNGVNNMNGIPDPQREHDYQNGLCFKCKRPGHKANECRTIIG